MWFSPGPCGVVSSVTSTDSDPGLTGTASLKRANTAAMIASTVRERNHIAAQVTAHRRKHYQSLYTDC